ncbi:hypothetical protein ACFQ1S_20300, partial [Kibdelosporangium lantanae]
MNRRLKHALIGITSGAAAVVVVMVLANQPDTMVGMPIIVPQAQDVDPSTTTRPSPVSEPPSSTTTTVDTTTSVKAASV